MENKIVMISIERLHQHPKNPRKNIGDVTELAESIAKSGILQNLTVVPWMSELTGKTEESEYTVVIGHRRLAAAKKAGLKELPCVVKEMSPAEQLATMLAENVQRNDLTPIEQAEGIQMMFDIGETVSDVVQKTGLSESTVRRRAKLLELDRDKLHQTEGRGATLADYEKLGQIKDIKARNKVLESIGTNNFDMEFRYALNKQTNEENRKKLIEILDTFAERRKSCPKGYEWDKYLSNSSKLSVPKDAKPGKYVYVEDSYSITLYKKTKDKKETAEEKALREKKQREEEHKGKIRTLAGNAYELRKSFIKEFNPAQNNDREIKRFLWNMIAFAGAWVSRKDIDELCGTSLCDAGTYEEKSAIANEFFENNPEKAMLQTAYLLSGDNRSAYLSYSDYWEESKSTDKLYECLERLGYQMSDDEKKLQDGTHELFKKE